MLPPFHRGEKHEARQTGCRSSAPRLCCAGHAYAGGGVSSLPRSFLLKNQNASMISPAMSSTFSRKKKTGRRNRPASLTRPIPTRPTAASCRTGLIIMQAGVGGQERMRQDVAGSFRGYKTGPGPHPPDPVRSMAAKRLRLPVLLVVTAPRAAKGRWDLPELEPRDDRAFRLRLGLWGGLHATRFPISPSHGSTLPEVERADQAAPSPHAA